MKNIICKAPLYLFIYISFLGIFLASQKSSALQIYFPLFSVEGEAITEGAKDLAKIIEQIYIEPRKNDHTLVMSEGITDEELGLSDEDSDEDITESLTVDNSNILAVMDQPEPEPVYGPPLEGVEYKIPAGRGGLGSFSVGEVNQSYFDDAVFLGDSRTVGLSLYSGWTNCDYLCDVGMTIYDCLDRDIEYKSISHTTARNILTSHRYGKVYIMLGINECGSRVDTFINKYAEVVQQIHEWQPDAVIVVQSIMCVGAQKSASHKSINNPNINARNEKLKEFANNSYIVYLNINEAVCDENGNLREGYSFDQVHLYAKYYSLWCDYLLKHGLVFKG